MVPVSRLVIGMIVFLSKTFNFLLQKTLFWGLFYDLSHLGAMETKVTDLISVKTYPRVDVSAEVLQLWRLNIVP